MGKGGGLRKHHPNKDGEVGIEKTVAKESLLHVTSSRYRLIFNGSTAVNSSRLYNSVCIRNLITNSTTQGSTTC